MNYEQRKNIGTTFEITEANNKSTKTNNENIEKNNENTETKTENFRTKIKNLIEHALLKKPHDLLLKKDHDSSEQRTKQIILSTITQLAEQYTKLDELTDDTIVSQVAVKSAFAIDHEYTRPERADESSVMQEDPPIDERATTETNNVAEKRSLFGKLHNKTNIFISIFDSSVKYLTSRFI